ncbi:MAG: DUF4169 family protein [Pseudomonadota bacterium]
MGEVVNLRAARKAAERDAARAKATGNAAKHGRSKALKALETARAAKAGRDLDGAKRDAD